MSRMNAAADRVRNMMGAIGGALALGAIVGEVNKTISALADLDDMAQKTGASVENLSRLSKVATMTGVDFGLVDGAIVKLAKNLSEVDDKGNKTAKALAAIGISTASIKGMDPAQVFGLITQKLQGFEDGAGKVALSTDLMGKSAANLLPYMNDFAENIDRFTGDSAEAAAAATKFSDDLGALKVKYEEIKTAIMADALPAMNDFIASMQDARGEANKLTDDTEITTWADDVALVMARMADGGVMVARTFNVVGESIKAAAANVELLKAVEQNANPINAAKILLSGGSPTDNIKAAFETNRIRVANAYAEMSKLWTEAPDAREQAMLGRIAGRSDAATMAGIDGIAGLAAASNSPAAKLNYSSGSGDRKSGAPKQKGEAWSGAAAADRMMTFALDETRAMKMTTEATAELIEWDRRRLDQMEEKMRAAEQITAGAEQIRQSLMTEVEAEQFAYESRIQQLQAFGALKLENEQQANALIEAETARHAAAKADIERSYQLQALGMAGNSADQLYQLLEQAGMQQTALGKALFIANKAIAVAEIIMNTEVAASAALKIPVIGVGLAAAVRAMGYASAGVVIGTTIASAEGGYDIPAGVNPVTQLHEKEMVLPKAQAEVIRNLATNGRQGGGGASIHYAPQIHIDSRTDQGEVQKLVYTAIRNGNADLVDQLQRAGRI